MNLNPYFEVSFQKFWYFLLGMVEVSNYVP